MLRMTDNYIQNGDKVSSWADFAKDLAFEYFSFLSFGGSIEGGIFTHSNWNTLLNTPPKNLLKAIKKFIVFFFFFLSLGES